MSFSRKNWSALSSLARQRTLEDEEEQARERRRRNRQLSSTTDAEEETLSPAPNANKPALERLRSLEKAELPTAATAEEAELPAAATAKEAAPERKLTEMLRPPGIRRQRRLMESSGNLNQEKEQLENCRKPNLGASRLEASLPQGSAQDGKGLPGLGPRRLAQDSTGPTAKRCPESAPEQKALAGERQGGPARDEKDLRGDKPREQPVAVRDQPQGSAQEQRDPRPPEVKIQCRTSSHVERKPGSLAMRPTSQQGTAKTPVRAPESAGAPSTRDGPRDSPVASSIQVTYSSSLKRFSPRTVSLRVIARKDQEDNALTRSASVRHPSASVRHPASGVKIEEKLEKYNSAVQRSEVKSPVPMPLPRKALPSSEGVASKRSIFEASALGKADPAPVKKENLRLPGVVTSRINLWISRAQEPSQDGRTKDAGKTDGVPRHGVRAKQASDAASDTRL